MELLTLRELCEEVGVSRRSIQCYEKAGLLMPTDRNKYGHLLYDMDAMYRAEKIKFLHDCGFELKEIKEVIDVPRKELKEILERRLELLEKEAVRMERFVMKVAQYIEAL